MIYNGEGNIVMDDALPTVPGTIPDVWRVKVNGFNEPTLWGTVPMKDGTSVGPLSTREIDALRAIGLSIELIPVECPHCQALAAKMAELEQANQELGARVAELSKRKQK